MHNIDNLEVLRSSQIRSAYVIEQTDTGVTTIDLDSRLMSSRIIFLKDEVTSDSINTVISQLLYLNTISTTEPITLYIDSYGGSLIHALCLIDIMQNITAPVHTYCIGMAYSAAFIILAAGEHGHRTSLPSASIMMHDMSGGMVGTYTKEVAQKIDHMKDVYDRMVAKVAELTGKSIKQIKDDLISKDKWFNAEQAKSYGVIDKIVGQQDKPRSRKKR